MSMSRIVERFREQEVKETAAIVLSDKTGGDGVVVLKSEDHGGSMPT